MGFDLQKLPRDRRGRIRRGEPIRECGLDFFPITMDHYDDYVMCKDALTLRLSSLPVKYVSMDYLSAIFAMEMDALKNGEKASGLFWRLMQLLGLSLRTDLSSSGALNDAVFYKAREKRGGVEVAIDRIHLVQTDAEGNEREADITPFQFSAQIRPLIAAQNQILLPDESENNDLVEAYEKKKQIQNKGPALDTDLDSLVSSVAYLSGVSDREIMAWNVRDFENRRRAIDRDKHFMLYAQAEMSGMVTFKNGNPYPSWMFDAIDDKLGTMEYAELANTLSGAAAPGSM